MKVRRSTTVKQLHGNINLRPEKGPNARLLIDLDKCTSDECSECVVSCSYHYHPPGLNNGIISVIELATYALICRRCDEPHCVNACPKDALEQIEEKNKMLVRHTLRCVSCYSCSHACPYGTIYPELVPRLANICNFCFDRRISGEPVCIKSCPYGALQLVQGDMELDDNTFYVGDYLLVHSTHWNRDKA